jgi:hypothetical protein
MPIQGSPDMSLAQGWSEALSEFHRTLYCSLLRSEAFTAAWPDPPGFSHDVGYTSQAHG